MLICAYFTWSIKYNINFKHSKFKNEEISDKVCTSDIVQDVRSFREDKDEALLWTNILEPSIYLSMPNDRLPILISPSEKQDGYRFINFFFMSITW